MIGLRGVFFKQCRYGKPVLASVPPMPRTREPGDVRAFVDVPS